MQSAAPRRRTHRKLFSLALTLASLPTWAFEPDWSLGVYGGKYYDTEPASMLFDGRGKFQSQQMLALTGSKTLWRSDSLPLSLELDAMVGHQWGIASLQEVAVAPVLRWSGFPWNDILQTDVRFGPLGVSYTSDVGPMERNPQGQGSQWLNFLMVEVAVSHPQHREHEVFMRLHHRCTIYDMINDYGANGEDFLALGYRYKF